MSTIKNYFNNEIPEILEILDIVFSRLNQFMDSDIGKKYIKTDISHQYYTQIFYENMDDIVEVSDLVICNFTISKDNQ